MSKTGRIFQYAGTLALAAASLAGLRATSAPASPAVGATGPVLDKPNTPKPAPKPSTTVHVPTTVSGVRG
ncbi:MAG: hypothetical protein ACRED9_06315 [Caulobacteraceae bacterium]